MFYLGGGEVLYEVNVHTGDVKFAGTDANILIQFYGDKLHSKSINLSQIKGNYDDPFEANQTDIFQVSYCYQFFGQVNCYYTTYYL